LDLPRRGIAHPKRGIGAIAETLAEAVRTNSGSVRYRSEVTRITRDLNGAFELSLKRGERIYADVVIINMPLWNISTLMKEDAPSIIRRVGSTPRIGWGAFTLYIGFDTSSLAADFPLHHQVVRGIPLGEGNSAFLSISPAWDATRAPQGHRVITMSTHTWMHDWWSLHKEDLDAYEARKAEYVERMLDAAEVVLPTIRSDARLILPGTPVTFQRFTRRAFGWVGGFPQTSLLTAYGPRLDRNLWMVGDSIFPGQSIPGVALGGLRVARSVLQSL
jgi:phytoene dehydrogenase-like protein